MIVITKKQWAIFFLAIGFISVNNEVLKASYESPLSSVVLECVASIRRESCRKAMVRVESLQSKAATAKNYLCQSYSLGLQADLVMTGLRRNRRDSVVRTLKKLDEVCSGI